MNRFPFLRLTALLTVITASSGAALVPIPDGDFKNGQNGWVEAFGGEGTFTFEYPATGGNPDGHGIIDNTGGGGWGIWISNFQTPILLADLGLSAGKIYTFKQDMKILSGTSIGGFKIDFNAEGAANGSTGDIFPNRIGNGSTWETYDFDIAIPAGTDGIIVVPLWGADSRVAYDNVSVDDTPIDALTEIPDADFEDAGGLAWETNSGDGTFVFSFPANGGNPDGHATIDHSANDGGWALLVTANGTALPLSGLGLTAGEAYTFSQDMKIFSGENVGGFKVDFFKGATADGSTGDIFPELIGNGTTWETYDFQVRIPATTTAIKIVSLWGSGSLVGYDNISFDTTPINIAEISKIPNGDFEDGSKSWAEGGAPNTTFTYNAPDGNPGKHGIMTNNGSGFGVWVANGGAIIPLGGLGLSAGETYVFSQDMQLLSGSEIGGLKVEFYKSSATRGDSTELRIPLIGDGTDWQTYDYKISIPFDVDGIKVVPLWGAGSSVAFDNFTFNATPIPSPPVLNPGFEDGSVGWSQFGEAVTFDFPESGGNPGRYATMNNTAGGGFGVLVANASSVTPISKFGIVEDETYDFQLDMRIIEGNSIGGLKLEFSTDGVNAGSTGDIFPPLIGNGSTWETYTFEVYIPSGVNGLKVVPLWGPNSIVGYDNIVTPGGLLPGFAGWISGFPDVGELTGFNDDSDGDGQANGLENFLGTDPSKSSQGLITGASNAQMSSLTLTHSQNPEPTPEASIPSYEWSPDLVNYYSNGESNPGGTIVNFNVSGNSPAAGTTTVRAAISGTIPQKIFVRLSVTGNAP